MASSSPCALHLLILHLLIVSQLGFLCNSLEEFWVDSDADMLSTHGDYSPPSPPPPPPLPHPPAVSCTDDLKGFGSLDTLCELTETLNLTEDVFIAGNGSFFIHPFVKLNCPYEDCNILVNISGEFRLGSNAEVIAGTLFVTAGNLSFGDGSVVNVTALAGPPPEQTSGTPVGTTGGGGGHGGRGASCVMDNTKLPEDVWGGDAYSWASLQEPWSYGSKGGTTSKEEDYGGKGGGRIRLEIVNFSQFNGSLIADGGEGGVRGGGGSGGSIYIKSQKT